MRHAFRTEARKLAAQLVTRVLALIVLVGPFLFGAVLALQSGVPTDSLLGVWVHSSGFAVAFVVLSFAGNWGFPVIAGVVAGDLFASEDRYGTWKTILTRQATRQEVFTGKVLAAGAFAAGLLVLAALSSLAAGLIFTGGQAMVGLGGTLISPGASLALLLIAWLVSLLPLLAFMSLAVLFSVATRNGIMGVLGPLLVALVMQLLALVGKGSIVHVLLVGSAFNDWHGLLASHRFFGPLIESSLVSVAWISAALGGAWLILRRRDFAGAPVARRQTWVAAARVVLVSAGIVALLGAASNWGPVPITVRKVQAAFIPAFTNLTLLQQRLLGRNAPPGTKLNILPSCRRRGTTSAGPGSDWTCQLDVLIPQPGANPFNPTIVTYDMSVTADGCFKADAPPSFVGQQMMRDAAGKQVVNPLFTVYGCFDTT
ncbi:MAG TPA: ABC transporter permease [Solirubrobacteraceae bacterium]|nr:ABC transporter permease [Solirubrobacteraceae bacterium]